MTREIKFRVWDKKVKNMQFTGLKDKNGKDVYEGDLVNIYNINMAAQGEITFDEYGARIMEKGLGFRITDLLNNFGTKIEILGNIHENPELINN